jgi:hypothetical protein
VRGESEGGQAGQTPEATAPPEEAPTDLGATPEESRDDTGIQLPNPQPIEDPRQST